MEGLKLIFLICVLAFHCRVSSQDIKLASPAAPSYKKMLNQDQNDTLRFDYRLEGSGIRYTLDGSIPSTKSNLVDRFLVVSKPSIVTFRAYHSDFLPSEVNRIKYFQKSPLSYTVTCSPSHTKYSKNGVATLHDGKFGNNDFHQSYLGFEGDTASMHIKFKKKTKIKHVYLSTLTNQSSWIFGPSMVIIKDQKGNIVARKSFSSETKTTGSSFDIAIIDMPKAKLNVLVIEVIPLSNIPQWHEGQDKPAWLFIDEVWVD